MPFVVDAVEAMAYALHDMHKALCPRKRWICSDMLPLAGPRLLEYIRNTSFIGMSGCIYLLTYCALNHVNESLFKIRSPT